MRFRICSVNVERSVVDMAAFGDPHPQYLAAVTVELTSFGAPVTEEQVEALGHLLTAGADVGLVPAEGPFAVECEPPEAPVAEAQLPTAEEMAEEWAQRRFAVIEGEGDGATE